MSKDRGHPVVAPGTKFDPSEPRYRPEYDDLARRSGLLGYTQAEFGALIGLSESTIHKWMQERPGFARAWHEGAVVSNGLVAEALFIRACGFTKRRKTVRIAEDGTEVVTAVEETYYPPDTQAITFYLKNRERFKWRDGRDLNIHDWSKLTESELELIAAGKVPETLRLMA